MNELQQEKIVYYAMGYFVNINYLILFFILGFYVEEASNPMTALYVVIGGTLISMIASTIIIRTVYENDNELSTDEISIRKTKTIIKLALGHLPALLSVFVGILILFVL